MEAEYDLNALPLFLALARAGSFTGAAERLGCNKSKISLSIKRLEQRLGVALVTRTTRQVHLTEAGERLLAGLTPLFAELEGLLDQVETDQQTLQGELRITAPEDFAAQVVAPAVVAFSERHPQLEIELRTGDSVADMVKEGIDLAIRLGWLKDSSLRATRLGEFEQFLVASPAFMANHGPVSHPRDLAALPWVTFT
ncbi:LysR family transcriptional regulator, partial [uncultured Alcanivorax sp.]